MSSIQYRPNVLESEPDYTEPGPILDNLDEPWLSDDDVEKFIGICSTDIEMISDFGIYLRGSNVGEDYAWLLS